MKCLLKYCAVIRRASPATLIIFSLLILIVTGLLCLFFGAAYLSFDEILALHDIIRYIRIPRVLAAISAGAGLAGAGVVLQTLLSNPLAGPSIIGVNSGAGLFSAASCVLFPLVPALYPVGAFLGSMAAVVLIFALAKKSGVSKTAVLLAGIILNSLFMAATEALYTFFPDILTNVASFRTGGFSALQTSALYPAMALIVFSCAVVWIKANSLELLSLGDETAHSLGLAVKPFRRMFLICASCMAGAAVSFAGLIGFLGLIIPHIVRAVFGSETRYLFPLSVIWGGIFLLICDTFARTAFAPFELPVGIVLAAVGAPIFISILLNKNRV